jgi:histidinol-phosphate aminotransferase
MQVSSPTLLGQDAYTPGLSREHVAQKHGVPLEEVAKLGSAENPLGPSPAAAAALDQARARIAQYPEWTSAALRQAIAARYGFEADNVICGAGETEVISFLLRAFAGAGEPVLMHEPCFPIYHIFAENEGRIPVYVPMGPDFDLGIDRYIAAMRQARPRIAFVTNPHSPTGRFVEQAEMRRICEAAGEDTLVVSDEAYIHFTETEGAMELAREYRNLIVLRTFSKAFGLAGLRIGFGVAGNRELIRPLLNLKPTWNLGHLQVAGGAAAIGDDAHVRRTVAVIVEMRAYVADRLAGLNRFRLVPGSRSNFFLLEVLDPGLTSTQVFEALLERGVIVKDGSVSFRGLGDRYLRIDVSLKRHMDRLVWALKDIEARGA